MRTLNLSRLASGMMLWQPSPSVGATMASPWITGGAIRRALTVDDLLARIGNDPVIRSGKPVIRGTRITVTDILEYLAGGMSEGKILAEFPELTADDVKAALTFAAQRERRLDA